MNFEQYQDYLAKFHAKDYDGVLDYYAPDREFELVFFGTRMTKRAEIKNFYSVFHDHLKEEIAVHRYVYADGLVSMEATVKVTGLKDLSVEDARAKGVDLVTPVKVGEVAELEQFIHYHLENGKIVAARCALYQPPAA